MHLQVGAKLFGGTLKVIRRNPHILEICKVICTKVGGARDAASKSQIQRGPGLSLLTAGHEPVGNTFLHSQHPQVFAGADGVTRGGDPDNHFRLLRGRCFRCKKYRLTKEGLTHWAFFY